jgi:predicted dinucleotide-binding enzyme
MWHMKRCAVLGSGEVGQTLSKGLKKHGYEVRIAAGRPPNLATSAKAPAFLPEHSKKFPLG